VLEGEYYDMEELVLTVATFDPTEAEAALLELRVVEHRLVSWEPHNGPGGFHAHNTWERLRRVQPPTVRLYVRKSMQGRASTTHRK
jgi:hypothetical protein